MPVAEEKQRAREQWTHDPAGAVYGREHEFGTREFFEAVERHRYTEYAPWMPEVMGFHDFAGARLLEVGCGMGTDLLQFARGGAKVTGVDLTPRSIEISRQHLAVYGEGGDFAITDGESLPFADESFDVVYSWGVLHHTPDTGRAVREVHRVLRPGGQARIMLYSRRSWVAVGLWLRHALARGRPDRTLSDVLSRHLESPGTQAFTGREIRRLFDSFSSVSLCTFVTPYDRQVAGPLTRLLPAGFFIGVV